MIAAYRDASYFEGKDGPGYSNYLAQEPTLRRTFRRLLRAMAQHGMTGPSADGSPRGRLLEIGSAYGFFLDEAKPFFAHRAGTEFSETGAAAASPLADRIYVGGLEALPDPDEGGSYDAIVLIHTIEHVYDPVALLSGLAQHLVPGGWFVVATPDIGGFWRPLLRRLWPFWKPPEHVAYYDAKTLDDLLRRVGCVEVRRMPYVSYFPLSLVREKLTPWRTPSAERPAPGSGESVAVWFPATTVAAAGRRPLS